MVNDELTHETLSGSTQDCIMGLHDLAMKSLRDGDIPRATAHFVSKAVFASCVSEASRASEHDIQVAHLIDAICAGVVEGLTAFVQLPGLTNPKSKSTVLLAMGGMILGRAESCAQMLAEHLGETIQYPAGAKEAAAAFQDQPTKDEQS